MAVPRVSFDFDWFNFHVPIIGSAAYNAPAAKTNPKLSAIVLVFISLSSKYFTERSMLLLITIFHAVGSRATSRFASGRTKVGDSPLQLDKTLVTLSKK
jgi:hypothetical protein